MSYDAIVIGGGLIGLSVAWRLGTRGVRTLLVERGTLGAGTSSRGVGGIRQQFDTPINIALSQLSLPVFIELGEQIAFQQHGYLYLALSAATAARLRQRAARQHAYNVPVEVWETGAIRARFPYLNIADIHGGTFCAGDGYADPKSALAAYAVHARANDVRIVEGVMVTRVRTVHGRVAGVTTDAGEFDAPVVVNAAGPWAAQIAATAGVAVPVVPLKRQVWLTAPTTAAPATAPLTIDADTGWHFRPRDGRLLLAMAGDEVPGETALDLDPALAERMLEHGRQRLPGLTVGLERGWAGLYELTPDAHPVLGMAAELPGFYLACGFSGHGFMHSPAAGILLAAQICGERAALDISSLAPERFRAGRLLGSGEVL